MWDGGVGTRVFVGEEVELGQQLPPGRDELRSQSVAGGGWTRG